MSIALLSLRVAAICCSRDALPLFATDVRDVFCIFLLSLHIFNVGTPYRRMDTRQTTFESFQHRILLVKLSLTRTIRVTIKCFINCTRNNI
jgi:hypothetical protein